MSLTFSNLRKREAEAKLKEQEVPENTEQTQKGTKKASTKKAGDK